MVVCFVPQPTPPPTTPLKGLRTDTEDSDTSSRRTFPEVVATPAITTWTVLSTVYDQLGLNMIDDAVFKALVIARIVRPTENSKAEKCTV